MNKEYILNFVGLKILMLYFCVGYLGGGFD